MTQRPNILFIMVDQARADLIGRAGHPGCPTPNLDRLEQQSLSFQRAYCTAPMCTPARGAILTGLYPALNGANWNDATPYRDVSMMGDVFTAGGYSAAWMGKWHLDGGFYMGHGRPDGGFEPRWWYDGRNWADDIGPDAYEHFKRYKRMPLAEKMTAALPRRDCWATRVADRAISFLAEKRDNADRPWMLGVSFDEPHQPHMAPPECYEAIDVSKLTFSGNVNASLEGKPLAQRRQRAGSVNSDEDIRSFMHSYFACMHYVDQEIGRILDHVDDQTVVIFTSDHGEMMASHGLWSKPYHFYEESIRAPLLLSVPGRTGGQTSDQLVSHVDILPTMIELGGVPRPEALHGRSLLPLLDGPAPDWRDRLLVAFDRGGCRRSDPKPNRSFPTQVGYSQFHPQRCLVEQSQKLIVNLFDTDEHYDLRNDPQEMTNLLAADRPASGEQTAMLDRLTAEMAALHDPLASSAWRDRPWARARESA